MAVEKETSLMRRSDYKDLIFFSVGQSTRLLIDDAKSIISWPDRLFFYIIQDIWPSDIR